MAGMEDRSRRHEWSDPMQQAAATLALSGSQFFEAWASNDIVPPIASTLGFHLDAFGEGSVEIGCTPQEFHYSPYGTAHGGLAATLLDTATGCAIHTMLPLGTGYATLELKVNYLRPLTVKTGPVRALGTVISLGSRVGVSEARIVDTTDRPLAHATSTCLIMAI